ncbi:MULTISPECIES: hypothetical protein [unclassified Bradyrhizobium]|uniref:hypothetical protein n=1 Tax=unclassified Bradyrhizobium TaxID=2631580 RepID=UPI0028F0A533|nr:MULTISPECIES: hypothetical protein [unclassified Bradyrhizobium]
MATTENKALDQELSRILEIAAEMTPVSKELNRLQQVQNNVWPWQVPQAPTYVSDHTPNVPSGF